MQVLKKSIMEVISSKYVVECLPDGEYYAYLLNYSQCSAFGETVEEALENLELQEEEFFNEIASVYGLEDMA